MTQEVYFNRRKQISRSDTAYVEGIDPGGSAVNEETPFEAVNLAIVGYVSTEGMEVSEPDLDLLDYYSRSFHEGLTGSEVIRAEEQKLGTIKYVFVTSAEVAKHEGSVCWPFKRAPIYGCRIGRHSQRFPEGSRVADRWSNALSVNLKLQHALRNTANVAWSSEERVTSPDEMSSFSQMLIKYKDIESLQELGLFLGAILKAHPKSELENWLANHWLQWLIERRIALAAVVEAAAQLSLPGLEKVIAIILKYRKAHPQVASVAAQRIRMVGIQDKEARKLWPHLKLWLEAWMQESATEEFALLGLPSGLYLEPRYAATWFAELIKNARPRIAAAATLSVLEWTQQHEADASTESRGVFAEAILARWKTEAGRTKKEDELLATLVWGLGAVVTEQFLSPATEILVQSFQSPRSNEDAAAVRAARVIYRRFGPTARKMIASKFGGFDSEAWHRFEMALMRPVFAR